MKRPPEALAHLPGELELLHVKERLRPRPEPVSGLSFASNDYLGLAGRPSVPGVAGAGASRLIVGEKLPHRQLERALASWLGSEDALVFSSGYAANVGVLSSLLRGDDLVLSDALNHASIIDGVRLARSRPVIFPHLDLEAVGRALAVPRTGRAWVVTESYFSMDADSPDFGRLRQLCDEHRAGLIVDEAHALGVLGPEGRGGCAAAGIDPDVLVGTLGKAFGAAGAFVAGCRPLTDWLWNRARSFVFSTGISPTVAATALEHLQLSSDPSLRNRVLTLSQRFRSGLASVGAKVLGHGHIVPWVLGTEARALQAAAELQRRGVHAVAIRPPTVPEGTSRVRFTITASHDEAIVDHAVAMVGETLRCLGD